MAVFRLLTSPNHRKHRFERGVTSTPPKAEKVLPSIFFISTTVFEFVLRVFLLCCSNWSDNPFVCHTTVSRYGGKPIRQISIIVFEFVLYVFLLCCSNWPEMVMTTPEKHHASVEDSAEHNAATEEAEAHTPTTLSFVTRLSHNMAANPFVKTLKHNVAADPLYWRRRAVAGVLFLDSGFTVASVFCTFSCFNISPDHFEFVYCPYSIKDLWRYEAKRTRNEAHSGDEAKIDAVMILWPHRNEFGQQYIH